MPSHQSASIALTVLLCASAVAQHDACRDAVRHLAKSDFEKGLATLEKKKGRMNSPSGKAELEFVRCLSACLQDRPERALAHARTAVEAGLGVDRLQAGPRDALAPLHRQKGYAALGAQGGAALLHGPMLGTVSDSSACFWVRTAGEATVGVEVCSAAGGEAVAKASGKSSAGTDYTAVVKVTGLAAATEYGYSVFVGGEKAGDTASFRTFPGQGARARFAVGFGGGAGFTPQNERMWETILARKPLAFLMLGDNVYIDDPQHVLTQRYCYYRRQARPEWRRFAAATAMYAIYDDHDFGTNDCVPGPDIDEPAWKREVWEVFTQNWVNPAYGGGAKQPGCWYDFMIGDVHFIMLDCRYYRDRKGGSMIGPVQKAWLLDTLKASKGTFKVVASSVPWSPGVKPGSKDTWDGFAEEREEIFSLIAKQRINGVILTAADRHRSDLRRIPRTEGYDLYEVMSSRLTNFHTHGLVEKAKGSEFILGYNKKCSFGLLEFDTEAADPTATYRIITIDGEEVHTHELKLSRLRM
jgi:alkaline phosphatase D